MDETKKNTKLVIGKEDELTDIVSGILEAPTERVILTFAEDSDLLISPINLSVLLETADDSEKTLVAQIIKNPTGLRNSSIAGLTTTDSPNNPTEDMWLEAEEKKVVRLSPKPKEKSVEKKPEELPENGESSFEKKINDAIQRSRDGIATKSVEKSVQKEGVFLSLDEDLPTGDTEKVDDIEIKYEEFPQADIPTQPVVKKGFKFPKINLQNLWPFKKGLGNTSGFKKYLPIGILSLVLVTILAFVIYLQTGPFVKVSVYVEAKEVSIEKIFTGDENIQAIDFENLKIPIKVESVEKDRSSTIKATGKAYTGEKATGKVTLTGGPSCTGPLSLPAGQILLASGKSFKLDSATTVPCLGNPATDLSVHAIEFGTEYNIGSNQPFLVQGHLAMEVFGYNPSAFTGGSKQEYTVLSKSDVDTSVATLTDEAELEAENELRDASGDWSIIEDSITSEVVKDSTKTSVAVGAAGSDVDLSIKVKSSATYYLTEGFEEGIATLLTNEAQEKNLFEGDDNLDLGLNENIEKTISVVEDSKKAVKIKLVAKGNVSPKVDKEKIVNTLKEMKWEEGLEYLQTLHFSEKRISASFFPKNILSKYPYFPKRHGGIIIEVHNI